MESNIKYKFNLPYFFICILLIVIGYLYYNKHLNTRKHKWLTKKSPLDMEFKCHCGKIYSHRQSLHKHKKKCKSL